MLELENISVDSRLLNVSMQIPSGTLFGIIGPNGSGKTTLLKAICQLIKMTGLIYYKGKLINSMNRHSLSRLIHLVPQGTHVSFDYTVRDIVSMGCYNNKGDTDEALKSVKAFSLASRLITELSMGERQRVYLARALATQCPILLFDEPISNLDISYQIEIWELLEKLALEGKTVVVTNHDLLMTKRYCQQLALINQGKCLSFGKTDDVLTDQEVERTFGVSMNAANNSYELVLKN